MCKQELAKLIRDQIRDKRKRRVKPQIFNEYRNKFDSLPGNSDREKIIWLLCNCNITSRRVARVLRISYSTVRRIIQEGFPTKED